MNLAGRGPFRLLRDVPQIGFFLVAVILCVDLAVVGQRVSDNRTSGSSSAAAADPAATAAPASSVEQDIFGSPETGPLPGTAVTGYLAQRQAELARRVTGEPAAHAVAVVSFRSAQRVAALGTDLPGVTVTGIFVRAQLPGQLTPAGLLKVAAQPAAALSAKGVAPFAGLLAALTEDAKNNVSQADTVSHTDIPVNAQQQQAFRQEAANEQKTIASVKAGGPVLYGAVVSGTYRQLATLAVGAQVRLIDPADDGVTAATIVAHALAPDATTTTVPLEPLAGLDAP